MLTQTRQPVLKQFRGSSTENSPIQGGQEVTVHPDNTHLGINISLLSTVQHAVQCKMVG